MAADKASDNKLGFLKDTKSLNLRKCSSNFDDSVHKRDATTLSAKRQFDGDKELHISFKKSKVAIESKQGKVDGVEEEEDEELEEEMEEEVEKEGEEEEELEEEMEVEVEEVEEEVEEDEEVEEEEEEVEEKVEEEDVEVEGEEEMEVEEEVEMEEKEIEGEEMEEEEEAEEIEGEEEEAEEIEEEDMEEGAKEIKVRGDGESEGIEEIEEEEHLESQVKELSTKNEHFEMQQKELKSKENQFEGGEVKDVESMQNEFDGEPKKLELRENQYEALLKSFEEEIKSDDQSTPTIDGRSLQFLPSDETEILDNLRGLSDPSKVVLDIIQNPIIQKYKMGDNAVIIDVRDILLLEQLMRISPPIKPHVREEAMKLALNLKSYISENTENSVAVLGFLLLLSIYKLAPSFDEDEVLKLFGFAAQHKIALKLFGTMGFADKASDFVDNLIMKKQHIEAARFIRAYIMPTRIKLAISCIEENRLR